MNADFTFGPFRLSPGARTLLANGEPVRLGSRALEILLALVERRGSVVTKEDLLARVWPDTAVEEANLRVHVSALRRALGSDRRYIANVPLQGYCFVAPVEEAAPASAPGVPAPRAELPAPALRLIGRDTTVQELTELVPRRRFVTVVGAGGVGKTSVAVTVANRRATQYAFGAHFVDLAAVSGGLVPGSVGASFGISPHAQDPFAELFVTLRDKRALVVLDNCEHVAPVLAGFAGELVKRCPGVDVLTTSREPLRSEGEHLHRLPSLAVPEVDHTPSVASAMRCSGVQLFVELASAALDSFTLTEANVGAVVEIVRRLDGIPLAIELAAAQLPAFGIHELAARLDDRFGILTKGRRTALPRHQTLRATLDASYDSLDEEARLVLGSLTVYRGVFTLDCALAVAVEDGRDRGSALSTIAELAAKSLLVVDVRSEQARYRLLESTRAYAAEKVSPDARARHARRHAERCLELVALPLHEAKARVGDLRAAIGWAFGPGGDVELGLTLTAASARVWETLPFLTEYTLRLEEALARAPASAPNEERDLLLWLALGTARFHLQGPSKACHEALETALALAERIGHLRGQLRALWSLHGVRQRVADYRGSYAYVARFGPISERMGDAASRSIYQRILGRALHNLGDQAGALPAAEHALALAPEGAMLDRTAYDHRTTCRTHLGRILWIVGRADEARDLAERAIEIATPLRHPASMCFLLSDFACPVALWMGDDALARTWIDLLLDYAERHAFSDWASWARVYARALAPAPGPGRPSEHEAFRDPARHPLQLDMLATLRADFVTKESFARAQPGESWCAAEVLRARGEVAEAEGNVAVARDAYEQALALARRQGALAWELRAATSLAALVEDARILSPVYARFTQGFATRDLRKAAALLAKLGA